MTTIPAGSEAIELLDTYQDRDLYGDSTVPIVVACRADVPMDSNTLRRIPHKHGNLQRNTADLDEVEGIVTARIIIIKAAKPVPLRVDTPDFALARGAYTIDAAGKDVASPFAPVSSGILIWESPEVKVNTQ